MTSNGADPGFDVPVDPALYNGGCWSIDGSPDSPGPDANLYLRYARACKPTACLNLSALEAIQCLVKCCESPVPAHLNLLGHGKLGKIITGGGEDGGDTSKLIAIGNIGTWQPLLAPLKGRVASLRLWSCSTGQGKAGAKLLTALADTLGCPCYAPIGLIECCSPCEFALQTNTDWQHADAGEPTPDAGKPPAVNVALGWTDSRLEVAPNAFIALNQVTAFRISRGGDRVLTWDGDQASTLLQQIDVARPLSLRGGLGAVITARIAIAYRDTQGASANGTFSVYNDTIMKSDTGRTYYWLDDKFVGAALQEQTPPDTEE